MGLSVITRATSEPITLDEALAHCRISDDIENGLIAGYIIAARQMAERVLRCPIMVQTYDYTIDYLWPWCEYSLDSFMLPLWRTRVELPLSPVLSVGFVKYVDGDGNTQTLDPSQYFVRLDVPIPYVEPAYGVTWPVPRYQPACATIRFDAGLGATITAVDRDYANVRQALLLLISYWFDNRGSAQFGARARGTDAGAVATSLMPAELPPGFEALLSADARKRVA